MLNPVHQKLCEDTIKFYAISTNESLDDYNNRLINNKNLPHSSYFVIDTKNVAKSQWQKLFEKRNTEVEEQLQHIANPSLCCKKQKALQKVVNSATGTRADEAVVNIGNIAAKFGFLGFQQGGIPTYVIKQESDLGPLIDIGGTQYYGLSIGIYILAASITPSYQLAFIDQVGFEKAYIFTNIYRVRNSETVHGLFNTFSSGLFFSPGNVSNDFDKLFLDCYFSTYTSFLGPILMDIACARPSAELRFCSDFRLQDQFGVGAIDGVEHVSCEPGAYIQGQSVNPFLLRNVANASFVGLRGDMGNGGTSSYITTEGASTSRHAYTNCNVTLGASGTPFLAVRDDIASTADISLNQVRTGPAFLQLIANPDPGFIGEEDPRIRVMSCNGARDSYPRRVAQYTSKPNQPIAPFDTAITANLGADDTSNQYISLQNNYLVIEKSGVYRLQFIYGAGIVGPIASVQWIAVQLAVVTLAPVPLMPGNKELRDKELRDKKLQDTFNGINYTNLRTPIALGENALTKIHDIVPTFYEQGLILSLQAVTQGVPADTPNTGFIDIPSNIGSLTAAMTTNIVCYDVNQGEL